MNRANVPQPVFMNRASLPMAAISFRIVIFYGIKAGAKRMRSEAATDLNQPCIPDSIRIDHENESQTTSLIVALVNKLR